MFKSVFFYKLKIPPARFLDGTGHTSTSARPRPTVRPTQTLTSCSAVRKPERYDSVEPLVLFCDAKVMRPPLPRPEGSWKRIPVI